MKEQQVSQNSEYYSRIRIDIRKFTCCQTKEEMPELIQELNRKIATARESYR